MWTRDVVPAVPDGSLRAVACRQGVCEAVGDVVTTSGNGLLALGRS